MGNNIYFDLSKNKTGREHLDFSRSKTEKELFLFLSR